MRHPRWSLRRHVGVATAEVCTRCGPGLGTVVRVEGGVLVCDRCLHEIGAPPSSAVPRRRRAELPRH
ncbi:MAG: hypothetical protein ACT4QF_06385 [Sporichthyaceae bacterium]